MIKQTAVALLLSVPLATTVVAEETLDRECRGVAAGVVATMRAAGELPTQQTIDAAVAAARRACSAARSGLDSPDSVGNSTAKKPAVVAVGDTKDEEKSSFWDFLPSNDDRKAGNDRLRRLKTQ